MPEPATAGGARAASGDPRQGGARERLLRFPGALNLRDMGGYRAAGGRRVRWRVLFRSGQLEGLATDGLAQLAGLGIRAACDLRSNGERGGVALERLRACGIAYWARDHERSHGDLLARLERRVGRLDDMAARMRQAYRRLPLEQAEAYREIFRRLVAGEVPLVFNCAAGKDRTGLVAALILHALRVPREEIFEDYLATNLSFEALCAWLLDDRRPGFRARVPEEIWRSLMMADESYLATAFDELERSFGGVDDYLEAVLGVDADARAALQRNLLEPA